MFSLCIAQPLKDLTIQKNIWINHNGTILYFKCYRIQTIKCNDSCIISISFLYFGLIFFISILAFSRTPNSRSQVFQRKTIKGIFHVFTQIITKVIHLCPMDSSELLSVIHPSLSYISCIFLFNSGSEFIFSIWKSFNIFRYITFFNSSS